MPAAPRLKQQTWHRPAEAFACSCSKGKSALPPRGRCANATPAATPSAVLACLLELESAPASALQSASSRPPKRACGGAGAAAAAGKLQRQAPGVGPDGGAAGVHRKIDLARRLDFRTECVAFGAAGRNREEAPGVGTEGSCQYH